MLFLAFGPKYSLGGLNPKVPNANANPKTLHKPRPPCHLVASHPSARSSGIAGSKIQQGQKIISYKYKQVFVQEIYPKHPNTS